MQAFVTKRPAFILVKGRYVRDTRGREVNILSNTKGDSLSKFKTSFPIGYHKWA